MLDHLIFQQLKAVLAELLQSLGSDQVEALVLGGGYGRGEGGAFGAPGDFQPYNDYDLVLIHRATDQEQLHEVLRHIHEVYSDKFSIHVDITPIELGAVNRLPLALTWYELFKGHHVLYGPENCLHDLAERKLSELPETEWGRLLVNRGSGLLFTLWKHQGKPCAIGHDESFENFATRQIEKAWLSLGDVWLAQKNSYDTLVINRRQNWLALEGDVPSWSEYYLNAVEFKLNPAFTKSRQQLIKELSMLSALYSSQLKSISAATNRPLVGLYYTLKNIRPGLWLLSNPFSYPRERLKYSMVQELQGSILTRKRLIGSTESYIKLWEMFG